MSRIMIGDREVTNPAAKAAISIVVVPLTLMFVAAVLVGTFALVGHRARALARLRRGAADRIGNISYRSSSSLP